MQSLKDQLLKAKLTSKKQVRKVEHEKRLRQKKLGKEGLEQERALKQKALKEKEEKKKQAQQRQNRLRVEAEAARKARQQIEDLVARRDLTKTGFGVRRFYFIDSGDKIPFLEVSDDMARRLEEGKAAIVEIRQGENPGFFLVPNDVAAKLMQTDPETVRFWNREKA